MEYSEYESKHAVTLVGGFTAALTNTERNQWGEFVTSLPQFEEWVQSSDRLSLALLCAGGRDIGSDEGDRILKLMSTERSQRCALFGIAQEWYDKLAERRRLKAEKDSED